MQVTGARKVWGTYLFTSEHAVSTAVKKLTTLGGKEIKVFRKFRRYPGGKPRWWFVLKSEEDVLIDLETQWSEIELQTKWKLEPCFRPIDTDDDSSLQPPNKDAVTTVPNTTPNPATVSSNDATTAANILEHSNSDQDPSDEDSNAGEPAANTD